MYSNFPFDISYSSPHPWYDLPLFPTWYSSPTDLILITLRPPPTPKGWDRELYTPLIKWPNPPVKEAWPASWVSCLPYCAPSNSQDRASIPTTHVGYTIISDVDPDSVGSVSFWPPRSVSMMRIWVAKKSAKIMGNSNKNRQKLPKYQQQQKIEITLLYNAQ